MGTNISSESNSEPEMAGAASLPLPLMTIAEEKEALLKRLAELEEKEKSDLESQLKDKKEQVKIARKDFWSQRSKVQKELDKLRNKLNTLNREQVKSLQLEISRLTNEISKRKVKESLSCLDCPVCLYVCKPPTQV